MELKSVGIIIPNMAVCQNLVPLVNIKIAGKWMFIPLKMVLIGIDPYPYMEKYNMLQTTNQIPSIWTKTQWFSQHFTKRIQWNSMDCSVEFPKKQHF